MEIRTVRLIKYERSFIAKGMPYAPPDRIVTGYELAGMPAGQQGFAANSNAGGRGENRWQLLRVIDGIQGSWTGDFKTVDDLQAALEDELNDVLI